MSMIQESMVQASAKQASVVPLAEITVYLWAVHFLEGSLHVEVADEQESAEKKNMSLNLVALPFQTLHDLHQSITNELKRPKQWVMLVINKVKINNQEMF